MLHRPADSRLLSNLLSHEKDYVRSLYSQLDYGQASLASFSAFAAASPPPASRAIGFVAGALVGAHDALRAYVLAVDEWCEQLKTLKDVEEEVGNIARDREILVDRLIKASKSNNPKRRSIMSSGTSSSPNAAGFSSSTLTLEQLSFSNSKLNLAQSELQACETHLTEKEHILAQMRESILVGGLKARCKALVECGWKWAESGKASLKALDLSGVREKDGNSGDFSQKPLPNPHDSNARPSSDLSSSLAPSQSASQIFSTDMVSEQFHMSSGTSSPIRHGPLPEADIRDDSSQFALSLPPAHAISEQDHYVPSRVQTSAAAIGDSESSSADDETDERIYEVHENKLFSDSSPAVAKTGPKNAGLKTRLPSKRQDQQMASNYAGLPVSTSAPLPSGYASFSNANGSKRDAHGTFSSSNDSQQGSPRRRKGMSLLGLGAITGLFHRRGRTSSLSLVPGASASFPISGSAPASPQRGGQWLTRTNQNLKKVGQADNSSDEDITSRPGGSDTAINYLALRKKGTAPSFYSSPVVTEAGPGSGKIPKKSGAAGKKLRKPMDSAFGMTSGADIRNTRSDLEEVRKTGKKLVREESATHGVSDTQAQSIRVGNSTSPLLPSVSRDPTMHPKNRSSARASSFDIPSAVSDKRRIDTRSDPGSVPAGRVRQQASSSAHARRGQASLMSIIEDVSQRNRQGWLHANPNNLLVEIKAPKSVHTSTNPETSALPLSNSVTGPGTTSYGRSGLVGRRRDASSMEMQNAVVQRLSTISGSSSEPSLPLKAVSANYSTQRETPALRPPLRSALRNRTPSPNPSSFSTQRNGSSVQNEDPTRAHAKSGSNLVTKPLNSTSNDDDDAASVSSAYETGHEDLGDTSDALPSPPPPDKEHKLPNGLVAGVQVDGTQLSGSASSSGETVTRPLRRKSVRVSMQPTFSPTPPALTDYDEAEHAPWASTSVNERSISNPWSSRAAERNTAWENSSDEDEEYNRARQMLYTASKKLEKEVHRSDMR